jgi:D-threonate/D-erythronate kinase
MSRAISEGGDRPLLTILADDLSGATDSAVACATRGLKTLVALTPARAGAEAEVIAYDADTRRLSPSAAAVETGRLVKAIELPANTLLFKKVDSTLRGHLGPEIASLLASRREQCGMLKRRTIVVLAPAFPALGRTITQGRLHLTGTPVEETEFWPQTATIQRASLFDIMRNSELKCELVPIETVRAGQNATRTAMADIADRTDVLICDAEKEEDLATLARASFEIGADVVWAGSAGLVEHLLNLLPAPANCFS